MIPLWQRLDVEAKVADIFGVRPTSIESSLRRNRFPTAYQLAILVDDRYPEVRQALRPDGPIGGAGSGSQTGLVQYLAERLAAEVRNRGADYRIEAAALSPIVLGRRVVQGSGNARYPE
jgi:hypothetical protein